MREMEWRCWQVATQEGKSVLGRENRKYKGPETGASLANLRNIEEVSVHVVK